MEGTTRRAYLERLGLEAEPPSAEALQRLARAHVAVVPYETVWIHLGEAWTTDPAASAQRVAHQRRGGYCYHLNGAGGRRAGRRPPGRWSRPRRDGSIR